MSIKSKNVSSNAIFVADAHSMGEDSFVELLLDIESHQVICDELYLIGDIFELLFGGIEYILSQNSKTINLLNKLSKTIKIVYLEGNHDFNLKKIFPHIDIVPIQKQPLRCIYNDEVIYLSHGDNNLPIGYRIYTSIIRNKVVLSVLNVIDKVVKNKISKKLFEVVPKNSRYHIIPEFEEKMWMRTSYYPSDADVIIEGHYHQGKSFVFPQYEDSGVYPSVVDVQSGCVKYINLPAFGTGGYKSIKELI